jgi:hypothetical protein
MDTGGGQRDGRQSGLDERATISVIPGVGHSWCRSFLVSVIPGVGHDLGQADGTLSTTEDETLVSWLDDVLSCAGRTPSARSHDFPVTSPSD